MKCDTFSFNIKPTKINQCNIKAKLSRYRVQNTQSQLLDLLTTHCQPKSCCLLKLSFKIQQLSYKQPTNTYHFVERTPELGRTQLAELIGEFESLSKLCHCLLRQNQRVFYLVTSFFTQTVQVTLGLCKILFYDHIFIHQLLLYLQR